LAGKAIARFYIVCMRPIRPANAMLRVAFAVLFGFVSLAHGPVMAFANAHQPIMAFANEDAGSSHHHQMLLADAPHGGHQPFQPSADKPAVCYSVGCFVAVEFAPIRAPAVGFNPLEKLSPAPARTIIAVISKPADPPPRLQA